MLKAWSCILGLLDELQNNRQKVRKHGGKILTVQPSLFPLLLLNYFSIQQHFELLCPRSQFNYSVLKARRLQGVPRFLKQHVLQAISFLIHSPCFCFVRQSVCTVPSAFVPVYISKYKHQFVFSSFKTPICWTFPTFQGHYAFRVSAPPAHRWPLASSCIFQDCFIQIISIYIFELALKPIFAVVLILHLV